MDKKVLGIVAVVAVVAVVAIVGVTMMNNGGGDKDTYFLVEDQEGVYFWASSSEGGYLDAFKDALSSDYYDYELSPSTAGTAIVSINGLAQTADWSGYWALYYYKDNAWVSSDWYIDNIEIKDLKYLGLFYTEFDASWTPVKGGPELLGDKVPSVNDAVAWKNSTDGVFFQVQSSTGFYTGFNGTGENAYVALQNGVEKYKIPFGPNEGGINWLYNEDLYMKQVDDQWYYWQQYIPGADGTTWIMNNVGLVGTTDVSNVCLFYNYWGTAPTVPVYTDDTYVTITDAAGKEIDVKVGSTFLVVSSNQAEWAQILGQEDFVTGMCSGAFNNAVLDEKLSKKTDVGAYGSVTADKIADTGCTYLINPKSMGVKAATVAELESNYGIKTIVVNGFGDSMKLDAQNMVKITGVGQDKYDAYVKEYDEVVAYVTEATKNKDTSLSFLGVLSSTGGSKDFKVYSTTSELGAKIASINGYNGASDLGENKSAWLTITKDAFFEYDQEGNLDYFFIRSTLDDADSLLDDYELFYNNNIASYGEELAVVEAGHTFVIETDAASGCRDYIGLVIIADAFGFDVSKYDAVKLMNDFNQKYGFNKTYTEVLANVVVDA